VRKNIARHTDAVPADQFDEWVAERYEVLWPELFEPAVVDPAVAFLAELAGSGPILELGIGTGRLALPLSRRGFQVHGIERSTAMVDRLRAQKGGSDLSMTIGDFSVVELPERFTLAYLVRNTIMNVTSQEEQVDCFRNVAKHLKPGGRFVIEVMIPALRQLPPGENVRAFTITPTHLGFDEYIDLTAQISVSHHYWVIDGELTTRSSRFRYVWPSELDLMAQMAGLTLIQRWSDWERHPFTSDSQNHISVWEKGSPD
jgi:SAM-dependent methyltransferase